MWRIPPVLLESVAFLCVDRGGGILQYGATGFFVSVPSPEIPDFIYVYFVTAKHAVLEGLNLGTLLVRMNLKAGGSAMIKLPGSWIYSDDADVAVIEALAPEDVQCRPLGYDLMITPEMLRECEVGPGDEVFLCGLFDLKAGTTRNQPVVRVGHIAAMPSDSIPVGGYGNYPGYLIETRSVGGMSGAPVFVAFMPYRRCGPGTKLLGVFMAYWDIARWGRALVFSKEDLQRIASGIGAVTPVEEVRKLLMGDELTTRRRDLDAKIRRERRP